MPQAQSPCGRAQLALPRDVRRPGRDRAGVAAATRVAVVGGGQSALESAALLNEADADVEVLVRDSRARWGMRPQLQRPWGLAAGRSVLSARYVLGAGRGLPTSGAVRRLLGCCFTARWTPRAGDGCVSASKTSYPCAWRAASNWRAWAGPRHTCASAARAARRPNWPSTMCWPQPVTGSTWMLCPSLRRWCVGRWAACPARRLRSCPVCSSPVVSGPYFTGSLAAPMFGPMLRFVASARSWRHAGSPGGWCGRLDAADRTPLSATRCACVNRCAVSCPAHSVADIGFVTVGGGPRCGSSGGARCGLPILHHAAEEEIHGAWMTEELPTATTRSVPAPCIRRCTAWRRVLRMRLLESPPRLREAE